MKLIVWNMAGGHGYDRELHEAAWQYLSELDPDCALLQEAVPPDWAREHWRGLICARKYPGGRVPWGSAILVRDAPIEALRPSPETPWLQRLWGGTVVGRTQAAGGLWLASIHSKAESRHPSEFPAELMANVALCHPEKVWEVEQAVVDLRRLFEGERFVAGGDLNSSLLFDSTYNRDTNRRQFANLESAGFNDLRRPFHSDEQRTYFKPRRRHYQLDHVFSDRATLDSATGWRVLKEPASDLKLSDHAPIEVLLGETAPSEGSKADNPAAPTPLPPTPSEST